MQIKVLHIYRTYYPDPPGGIPEAIKQICDTTLKRGVESRVFALSPDPTPAVIERTEAQIVRAYSWAAPASCDLGGLSALHTFIDTAAWADVLHFHFPWPFADLLNLLPVARKPKLMTYHSDIIRQRVLSLFYSPLMRYTLRSMDAVVVTSPHYAQSSQTIERHVSKEKLKVVPLGIADITSLLPEQNDSSGIKDRLGLDESPFVLALGALRYYKGLHTLIQAANQIQGNIVIAGDGPEAPRLHSLAGEFGVSNVFFAGRVNESEKHDLLRSCRAFVFPSHLRSEAFGMVLLEAAMHGKPLVCCDIGSGMSYVNQNEVTGFLVPPESPAKFAEATNRFLHDPLLAQRMGVAARVRFLSLFSAESLGDNYSKLYKEIARQP